LNYIGFLAACVAACAGAQEMVTVPTREGVTQSFVIADTAGREARAVALMYTGGGGAIHLRKENGRVKFGERNFLPRSRGEFARNGIVPVVLDVPSDLTELSDYYRSSEEQTADARAVLVELKRRYPGLPVYIVGTSRGTLSAAHVARALGADIAGVVLTSSIFIAPGRRGGASLGDFDYAGIKAPLLFVHHRDDTCQATPYFATGSIAARYTLVSVRGGKPAESPPCEPLSPHGYYGREAATVDAIAAWMLKRPFPKDID